MRAEAGEPSISRQLDPVSFYRPPQSNLSLEPVCGWQERVCKRQRRHNAEKGSLRQLLTPSELLLPTEELLTAAALLLEELLEPAAAAKGRASRLEEHRLAAGAER